MDYRVLQNTKVDRLNAGITTHKILKIDKKPTGGAVLTVACTPRLSGGELRVPVSGNYEVGQWIDLRLEYTAYDNVITSYSCTFFGTTPSAFIPSDPTMTWA